MSGKVKDCIKSKTLVPDKKKFNSNLTKQKNCKCLQHEYCEIYWDIVYISILNRVGHNTHVIQKPFELYKLLCTRLYDVDNKKAQRMELMELSSNSSRNYLNSFHMNDCTWKSNNSLLTVSKQ